MKLIAVATLATTVTASSTSNGSRFKLLHKSKSAKKSSGSKSAKQSSGSKSAKSVRDSTNSLTVLAATQMDSSSPTNMPSVASLSADPTSLPLTGGLFGPYGQDLATPIPTVSTQLDDTVTSYYEPITDIPTADSGLFSFNVTLSSYTSAPPTISKVSNLINIEPPSSLAQTPPSSQTTTGGVQGTSIIVILACAMAILGTLYGMSKSMKKNEENVARAAEFDADASGGV